MSLYVLRYDLGVDELAISELRRGLLHDLSNLFPPTHRRAIGISEGYIFPMGEHQLGGLRVPFHELGGCEAILLDFSVKIIYSTHLLSSP